MATIGVSKTVYSAIKKGVEKKRKKVAKEVAELKEMEDSLKQVRVLKLSKR